MKNIIIDTHMHTKASDGTFTPEELVAYAASVGLEVIAKTDHDTTFGNDVAVAAGPKYGIKVIPGIEIDAIYEDKPSGTIVKGIELLGLNVDSNKMQPFCDKLSEIRFSVVEHATVAFNEYIQSAEFVQQNEDMEFKLVNPQPISIDDIVGFHNDKMQFDNPKPFLSKTTVMQYLMTNQLEQTETIAEALGGNRAHGSVFKAEYKFLFEGQAPKIDFYEAIDEVHNAGGKAVIAHPGRSGGYAGGMQTAWQPGSNLYQDVFTPEMMIEDLANHGLDGVELYNYSGTDTKHGKQEDMINNYFAAVADKLGLFVTYGSDCHGEISIGPQLGKFGGTEDYSHLLE